MLFDPHLFQFKLVYEYVPGDADSRQRADGRLDKLKICFGGFLGVVPSFVELFLLEITLFLCRLGFPQMFRAKRQRSERHFRSGRLS